MNTWRELVLRRSIPGKKMQQEGNQNCCIEEAIGKENGKMSWTAVGFVLAWTIMFVALVIVSASPRS